MYWSGPALDHDDDCIFNIISMACELKAIPEGYNSHCCCCQHHPQTTSLHIRRHPTLRQFQAIPSFPRRNEFQGNINGMAITGHGHC